MCRGRRARILLHLNIQLEGTQGQSCEGAELVCVLVAETIHPACMCEGGGRGGERGWRAFYFGYKLATTAIPFTGLFIDASCKFTV
jgi:hypothetical protein